MSARPRECESPPPLVSARPTECLDAVSPDPLGGELPAEGGFEWCESRGAPPLPPPRGFRLNHITANNTRNCERMYIVLRVGVLQLATRRSKFSFSQLRFWCSGYTLSRNHAHSSLRAVCHTHSVACLPCVDAIAQRVSNVCSSPACGASVATVRVRADPRRVNRASWRTSCGADSKVL